MVRMRKNRLAWALALVVALVAVVCLAPGLACAVTANAGTDVVAESTEATPTSGDGVAADENDAPNQGETVASEETSSPEETDSPSILLDSASARDWHDEYGYWVYLYVQVDTAGLTQDQIDSLKLNDHGWYTIGRVFVPRISAPSSRYTSYSTSGTNWNRVMSQINAGNVERYTGGNTSIVLSDIDWTHFGLKVDNGADNYESSGPENNPNYTWHLDGYIKGSTIGTVTINHIYEDSGDTFYSQSVSGNAGSVVNASDYIISDSAFDGNTYLAGYTFDHASPESYEIVRLQNGVINIYYSRTTGSISIGKNVSGSAANVSQEFAFTLSASMELEGRYGDVVFTNGTATVTLSHGETVNIINLPSGTTIDVIEQISGDAGTLTTVSVNGEEAYEVGRPNQSVTDVVQLDVTSGGTTTAVFTNTANLQPQTGISNNTAPMIGLLAVAGVGTAAVIAKRYSGKRGEDAWEE